MLKQALLSTILATATFTFVSAEPPVDPKDTREETGPSQDGGPSGQKAEPKGTSKRSQDPGPGPEAGNKGPPPPQEGPAARDGGLKGKDEASKKENDKRAKGKSAKQQDGNRAVEGRPEPTASPPDRAAKDEKRGEADRAKAEAAERGKGQTPKTASEPAPPSATGEAKTGASEEKETGTERASPDLKAEKRKQRGDTPAQAEGAKQQQESEGAKADQPRSDASKDTAREGDAKQPQETERDATSGEKAAREKSRADEPATRDAAGSPRREQRATEGKKQTVMPADEQKAKEVIREERVKADQEFEKAKESAKAAASSGKEAPRVDERAASRFEKVREQRSERVEKGGVALIEEPDKRVIVRDKDRAFIQHDEGERLRRSSKELRRERRPDGTTIVVSLGVGGVEITSVFNDNDQLVRRSRHHQGREVVLIDNSDFYKRHKGRRYIDAYVDLPPLALRIPREKYVVEYDNASESDVYDALVAPPLERLDRSYSLEEIRQSYPLRERMRRIDLDAINFAFASWEIDPEQNPKLERIAEAMKRIIERKPDEVFLIEGHTDAVGSDIDNLSLSDRRAETVAIVLTDTFRVPPENLTTQGYGEAFLKVDTEAPSRENRRVAVRRITPLLSHNQRQSLNE